MSQPKSNSKRWVLVKVESGIPVEVKIYQNEKMAVKQELCLRKHMHPENDETAIFAVSGNGYPRF